MSYVEFLEDHAPITPVFCNSRHANCRDQVQILPQHPYLKGFIEIAKDLIADAALHYIETNEHSIKKPIVWYSANEIVYGACSRMGLHGGLALRKVTIAPENGAVILTQAINFRCKACSLPVISRSTETVIDFSKIKMFATTVNHVELPEHSYYQEQINQFPIMSLGKENLIKAREAGQILTRAAIHYSYTKQQLLQKKITMMYYFTGYLGLRTLDIEGDPDGTVTITQKGDYASSQSKIDFHALTLRAYNYEKHPNYNHFRTQLKLQLSGSSLIEQAKKLIIFAAVHFSITQKNFIKQKIEFCYTNSQTTPQDVVNIEKVEIEPEGAHLTVTQDLFLYHRDTRICEHKVDYIDLASFKKQEGELTHD